MPRVKKAERQAAQQTEEESWQQIIVNRIKMDKVVPLISNAITDNLVFGSHTALIDSYADYIQYPLEDQRALSHLSQYRLIVNEKKIPDKLALRSDYIDFIKNELFDRVEENWNSSYRDVLDDLIEEFDDVTFSEFCERLGYPQFDDEGDPLLILASFPLSIYLTTSYHNFIEDALRRVGKSPRTEICRWHDDLEDIPTVFDDDYVPTPEEPLVYHLHGHDKYPESLILTEDDYLNFLVAISQDKGRGGIDLIPSRVRRAMADSSLILLGYKLRNWDFRVVFQGLIKSSSIQQAGVSIQLEPNEVEKKYLEKYLQREAKFEIYWGDTDQFMVELHQALEG